MLSYIEAKKVVHSLGLKSAKEWWSYIKANKLKEIRSNPTLYKEWISWYDWLGTKKRRTYSVNENFFLEPTKDMAYILGLIYTDGHIGGGGRYWNITLHEKDKQVLDDIARIIGFSGEAKKRGNCFTLTISSTKMSQDLFSFGLTENKTFTCEFPVLSNELFRHYIRGLWDGDGTVYLRKKEMRVFSSFISASKNFSYALLNILKKEIPNFHGKIYQKLNEKTKKTYYTLSCCSSDTQLLKEYLYCDGGVSMKRKKEIFELAGNYVVPTQFKHEFFLPFEVAKEKVQSLGFRNYRQFRKAKANGQLENIPANPDRFYTEWDGWETFLGTKTWDYNVAKEFVVKLGLKNKNEWVYFAKTERPKNIPSNPWSVYPEWEGMKKWLGHN